MSSPYQERLDALFERAVSLPAHEQDKLIDEVCADDPVLGAELRAQLLHGRSHGVLDAPAGQLHPSLDARLGDPNDAPRIARETLGRLGAGIDRRVVARSMWVGIWIWPSFILLDAYMCFVAFPGAPFWLFVVYRVVVELAFLFTYRASVHSTMPLRRLLLWQSVMYCAAAFVIALMALPLGGIRSPYMHGISIVALVWAALVPMPWRRALPTFAGIALAFPLVMGGGALLWPSAHAAWMTADALIFFVSHYVFVISSSTLGLILSHMVWTAEQQARRLGSYELEMLLGRGGMGEVWRARHYLLTRSAAIKVIRPDALGKSAERRTIALARFEREARATASLRSPHTVQVYDFGVSDTGAFYYVMELLEGLDAAELVRRFGPQPIGRVVHLLRQVCDSLGEAHAAGLVHRDIKPSNIHVGRYGRTFDFVKVLDFGLVAPFDPGQTRLTSELAITGTPAFMAPEQTLRTTQIDARSDLYALGCVAYWLLTGRQVFEGTAIGMLSAHVGSTPVPPSRRVGRPIPESLERLVLACLEKDPNQRPQTADVMAAALDELTTYPWTQDDARQWWHQHWHPTTGEPAPSAVVSS
jgi:serine/threonine-protein kinase